MSGPHARTLAVVAIAALALAHVADAQQPRRFPGPGRAAPDFRNRDPGAELAIRAVRRWELATIEQVQVALKLTPDQKSRIAEINEKFDADEGELIAAGPPRAEAVAVREYQERRQKITSEAESQLENALDESQRKRLREIWIQVSPGAALLDEGIARELELTDDQRQRIRETRRHLVQGPVRPWWDYSPERRRQVIGGLRRAAAEWAIAVLSAEQQRQFEAMQGERIEVDLFTHPLFRPLQSRPAEADPAGT